MFRCVTAVRRLGAGATGVLIGAVLVWVVALGSPASAADCYPPVPGCATTTSSSTTSTTSTVSASIEVDDITPTPGQEVIVTARAGSFMGNSDGIVTIRSVERQLGTFKAAADGSVRAKVRIPLDIELGPHTIYLKGMDPNGNPLVLSRAITVVGAAATGSSGTGGTTGPLAFTGAVLVVPAALLGLGLVGFGLLLKYRGNRLGQKTAAR
jgi:hypothetical protein